MQGEAIEKGEQIYVLDVLYKMYNDLHQMWNYEL